MELMKVNGVNVNERDCFGNIFLYFMKDKFIVLLLFNVGV